MVWNSQECTSQIPQNCMIVHKQWNTRNNKLEDSSVLVKYNLEFLKSCASDPEVASYHTGAGYSFLNFKPSVPLRLLAILMWAPCESFHGCFMLQSPFPFLVGYSLLLCCTLLFVVLYLPFIFYESCGLSNFSKTKK